MRKYYLDTCIWIDFFENRTGTKGEDFGEPAFQLLSLILAKGYSIIISDHLMQELQDSFLTGSIQLFLTEFRDSIVRVPYTFVQAEQARLIAEEKHVPYKDALHAVLAKEHKAILVTRDKHFIKLSDVVESFDPKDLV